ncbi:AraC family transcriptional regulator [Enterococcus sp. HY326]|uniref:AraC family transcriptional regulator n=1 Tax=Enterococcus sp. HY326 TaxID=2971265 RepID=UPI00223F14D2|nr:AraC family transcriptional regulator [Enterococcus sp. HY326]
MDWLTQLNLSLAYLEENLTETVSIDEAAKIARCSTYHYQRMFSYMADVSLGEYLRRRKMSLAGVDLQHGAKVIDVALKYGYDSPTAFNRAFKSIHGITPQAAKQNGAVLVSYPQLNFAIQIRGVEKMEYQIIEKSSFTVTGPSLTLDKDMEKSQRLIPEFWNETSQAGALEKLFPLMGQDVPGVLGVSYMTEMNAEKWEYVIGVATDQKVADFKSFEIPAATWAVFSGTGTMPTSIQELQKRIYTEWLPTSGYEYANLPDIEVYLNADPQNAEFQVWFPVKPKSK